MGSERIAVLGGGSGAHLMAAHMALEGEIVNLVEHPRFEKSFRPVLESGKITVRGIGPTGVAKLDLAAIDFARGLQDARWVHVVMAATGHELFFEAMLPHLQDGQNVVIWAGNMGSVRLYSMLQSRKGARNVNIFETNTVPYGTRLSSAGAAQLLLWATRIRIAGMPANCTPPLNELKKFYPQFEKAKNVLTTAFDDSNPTVHAAASILNVGRIEYSQGEFYPCREGLMPTVGNVIRRVYDEGAAVARKYGLELIRYRDEDFRSSASVIRVEFMAPANTMEVIASVRGPTSLKDRYIVEEPRESSCLARPRRHNSSRRVHSAVPARPRGTSGHPLQLLAGARMPLCADEHTGRSLQKHRTNHRLVRFDVLKAAH